MCSMTMKHDVTNHRMLLQSIDSTLSVTVAAITDVQHKVTDSVHKLSLMWNQVPGQLGYAWGPEFPIMFIDGLGRKSCLPLTLVKDASVGTFPIVIPPFIAYI
jgi:hypothetical protein